MLKKNLLLLSLLWLPIACSPKEELVQNPLPQGVLESALQAQGLAPSDSFDISFSFRNRAYRAHKQGGVFDYYRIFQDEDGSQVTDHLFNEGFERLVNGEKAVLLPAKAHAYSESVNSVIYFALLPYFLQDKAVQLNYLGEVSIKEQPYHKVRVTFAQEGGGSDHDDIFVYWFHRETGNMDYLAYSYKRDGGGVRFREAVNVRRVNGVRFANYINYKHENPNFPVEQTDEAFVQGKLERLSEIVLEKVSFTSKTYPSSPQ